MSFLQPVAGAAWTRQSLEQIAVEAAEIAERMRQASAVAGWKSAALAEFQAHLHEIAEQLALWQRVALTLHDDVPLVVPSAPGWQVG